MRPSQNAVLRLQCAGMVFLAGLSLRAQSPSGAQASQTTSAGTSRAVQLPLSGREPIPDPVVVTQQTAPSSAPNSVNVIDSTVTVQGNYLGGVPTGKPSAQTLPLRLSDALAMGLRQNLGALAEFASVEQARAQHALARSTLLPTLDTNITENYERINLRSEGVMLAGVPEAVRFQFFDARVRLTQTVFDLVRIRNLRGSEQNLQANIKAARNSRDLIVLAVGGSYLQLMSTQARVSAAAAQVESSRAIYRQAADRLTAGLVTRVDVLRAQVQLQTEQQRLRSSQADLDTQKLRFARLVGLPPGQSFVAIDDYPFTPYTASTLDESLTQAFAHRSDLQSAAAALKAAEATRSAAHAERLPNLSVNANFGAAGTTPTSHSTSVYGVTGALALPIYEGGRIRADEQQAAAAVHQRKAEYEDTRAQIDQDVRQAFIDLNAAADQVTVAQSNVDLSHAALQQSRDRFIAGVTDTVEVVQAEQAVVQADDDAITALYEHNLAKLALARAMGDAEQSLPQLLLPRKP